MERFAGRYALLRLLGQGGMGHVWLALDLTTGRECALKRLDLRLPHAERDSLRREFEVLARLRHPAIVGVHELGFAPDGAAYYTMDYVPGVAADAALSGADWPALYEVAARVSEGLEALHAAGIVHGDIKPSNLLVLPGGTSDTTPAGVRLGESLGVRLVDFGLAALLDRDRAGHRGTAGYAAREVVHGSPLSVASDLYSLGVTLHVLALTVARGARAAAPARPPADAERAALALHEHGVPAGVTQLILQLMSSAPETRPSSAQAVSAMVAEIAPHSRRSLPDRLDSEQVAGRGKELAQLERWLAAGPGSPPLMLLTGEPGIGKSTLLRELTVRAQLAGRPVISLACGSEGAPGAVGRTLLLRLAAAAEAVPGAWPTHADMRAQLESGPLPADAGAAAAAGLAWIAAVREHAEPTLVLLDDLDRLDGWSLTVVKRLVSGSATARWVWTSASATPRPADEVWQAAGLAESMTLGALALADVHDLVATRLRSAVPPELVPGVWERCGGHPGLTVEVLRIAARDGVLSDAPSGVRLDRIRFAAQTLPADFEAACQQRLADLPAEARAAAAALAVWNEPALPEVLRSLEPRTDDSAVEQLRRAGLLVIDEHGALAFQTPVFARVALAQGSAPERARLYRRALEHSGQSERRRFHLLRGAGEPARALEAAAAVLAHEPDVRLAEDAARLAAEAGGTPAAEWAVRAAQLYLDHGRYREARPHLEHALAIAPRHPNAAYWKFLLCGPLLRSGELATLEALLDATLAEDLPDRIRALLLLNRAAVMFARGDQDANFRLIQEALELAERAGDPEGIGLALYGRAVASRWQLRDLDRGIADARRAIEVLAGAGHTGHRLRATGVHAQLLLYSHQHEAADALARTALAEARTLGMRLAELELLETCSGVQAELGAWQACREFDREGLRLAVEEGLGAQVARNLACVAMWEAMGGDARRALPTARRGLGLIRRYLRAMEPTGLRVLATAYRNSGQARRAERWFRRSMTRAVETLNEYEQLWSAIEWGALYARHGRWARAAQWWRMGWELHPRLDFPTSLVLLLDLGRALLRTGQPEEAERHLEQAATWLSVQRSVYGLAHLHLLRAELALTRADAVLARSEVDAMLADFGRLPAPADRAWAAIECSRLASQRGLDGQLPVNDWLHGAAADFALCGDHRGREQALALAVDWYRRHSGAQVRGTRDRDLLQAVSRLLDSMADFDQLTSEAMRLAVEQLDAERGVLLLAGGEGEGAGDDDTLRPVVEFGAVDAATRDHAVSYSRDIVHRVRESGGSLVLRDARTEGERLSQSMVTLGLRSVLCVPLFVRSRLVGAVYLDDTRRAETFGDRERTLLEGFAELLASAIESSRGQARVKRDYEQLFDENLSLRRDASVRYRPHNIIGGSRALQRVMSVVERAAAVSSTVLITGENGTGKELIARMLHHAGPRSLKPFVAVNCGALTASLLESELFGILPDTATGVKARPGRFLEADGGTLFLDEIGEMPVQQQVALLRVLSANAVTPVGGGRATPIDVRVIAATNRDLAQDIEDGRFRQDLWFRLNVIPVELPPLRERRADIPALAQHFAATFAGQQDREVPELTPALMAVLMQSDWPGNVRELQNYIERLMAMTPGRMLRPDPLPHDLQKRARAQGRIDRGRTLREMVAELERRQVLESLERHGGNQSRAAEELGLTEQSLRYRLRRYALPPIRHFQRTR